MPITPTVSFLVPCFNGARWLDEALQSIAQQTFPDFEVVLVNDGSTDSSEVIMESWEKKDQRFRVFKTEQSGLVQTLNFGLAECKGSWIARLDQDDLCENNRIEQQMSKTFDSREVVLVGSSFFVLNEGNLEKQLVHVYQSHNKLLNRLKTMRSFFPHSSAFMSRNAVLSVGGYRSMFAGAEDWDLWLRMSDFGRITAVRSPLVTIRTHGNQMSGKDHGRPQIEDAHLASTVYFVRKIGGAVLDPSKSETDFDSLKLYLLAKLQVTKTFELFLYIRLLQTSSNRRRYRVMSFESLRLAFQRKLLIKSIKHLLFGSKLPQQVAKSYVRDIRKPRKR